MKNSWKKQNFFKKFLFLIQKYTKNFFIIKI